jgi:thiol-disulfide isomerase/thioredoxin
MLAALLVAAPLLAADKSADEKGNDRAAQFKQLQKDLQKTAEQARKDLQKVKTQEEFQKIVDKIGKEYTARIVKLVESDPKDKVSGEVLFWATTNIPLDGTKVYDLLAENWAKDARIKQPCQLLIARPQANAEKLLQAVLDQNSDKEIQGSACYALAKLAFQQAEEGDKTAERAAEKYYERAAKDFADVKLDRGKIGDEAKRALFQIHHLSVGKKAPNVESANLEDKKVQLKDYKGKVVVLDIWATWCPPCKAMIPHEREMVKKLKDKPFALISISADAEKKTLTDFIEKEPMPWTHWWNGASGGILKDWNVTFFPTIYVLDSEGVIRYKNIREKELAEAVEKLLAEVKDKK